LIKFVRKNNIETIGNEFCFGLKGEKKSHVREEIKNMLIELEKKNKFLFPSVKNALQNPEMEHLFLQPKKSFLEKIFFKKK
jgi:hypothetical protein